MEYRREIDGLRALAVLPVILYHAGFTGGFVGVDIFFVISGYLITSIILAELKGNSFSLLKFYERRARRILPALFLVMTVSSIFAYFWLLPDELKNFGQSLVATTLSSNNVLLAMTSGYWTLASEFKPLLHTWSLGVEEQYYVIFPIFMMLGWRYFKPILSVIIIAFFFVSLVVASYGVFWKPDLAFYLLPSRAWEIIIGSLIAFYSTRICDGIHGQKLKQSLGLLGFSLILFSIFVFDRNTPSPGLYMLVPVIGAALVILFATKETIAGRILGSRPMVGLGLISYSAYLWHQPVFAFARIYSVNAPNLLVMLFLALMSIVLAYLTWRFVETPFRRKNGFSKVSIWCSALILSVFFIALGLFLHKSYGLIYRIYDMNSVSLSDIDKTIYNQRVFALKKDSFVSDGKLRILVIGNSFARDFVNMTTETFELKNVEIIYRDNLVERIFPFADDLSRSLYGSADVIVFASGRYQMNCLMPNVDFAKKNGKELFYVGFKHFGFNLNWLSRVPIELRSNLFNPLLPDVIEAETKLSGLVPRENYISLLSPIVESGKVPITDEVGRLISVDRAHLTKFGAIYLGKKAIISGRYGELLKRRGGFKSTQPQSEISPVGTK